MQTPLERSYFLQCNYTVQCRRLKTGTNFGEVTSRKNCVEQNINQLLTDVVVQGDPVSLLGGVAEGAGLEEHLGAVVGVGPDSKAACLGIEWKLVKSHGTDEGDVC